MYQQHFVFPLADKHDNGCRDGRINFISARRTAFHNERFLLGGSAAYRTETTVLVPIEYLVSFAAGFVFAMRQIVEAEGILLKFGENFF